MQEFKRSRRRIAVFSTISLLLVLILVAVACGGAQATTPPEATATARPEEATSPPESSDSEAMDRFEGQTLNVLGWGDHFNDEVLDPFREMYGVTINVKETAAATEVIPLAKASPAGFYDVIVTDVPTVELLVENDILEPLDMSRFDTSTFFPIVLDGNEGAYEGETYLIPTKYGFMAVAYNTEYVDTEDAKSWDIFWNPKYEGKVGLWDGAFSVYGILAIHLGYEPGPMTMEQEEEIKDLLRQIKANDLKVVGYVADLQQALANESAWVIHGAEWVVSGLITDGLPVDWVLPDEGGVRWMEGVGIGRGTENMELAELLVQYIISPEGSSKVAVNEVFWGMPTNAAARDFLSEEELSILNWDNQAEFLERSWPDYYPPADVNERWETDFAAIIRN